MIVTLEEIKTFLRVDYPDDDQLLISILETAHKLCMDILRAKTEKEFIRNKSSKLAVMYAAAYLYEHREEADYNALCLNIRAMYSDRKVQF